MADNDGTNEQEDQGQDLAGYESVEDLAKAYRASGTEAKRWQTAAQQAQQAANQALQQVQALMTANPRQDIPQRNGYQAQLAEAGIPYDPIQNIAREEAQKILKEEFFEPMQRQAQARGQMLGKYGQDYTKFESDVYANLESDPELKRSYDRMVVADPVGAMDYAFLKFGESQRREHGGRARPERSSAEAQIPSNRSGESRRGPANGNDLQRAFEKYRDDPNSVNARNFAKARLHGVISDEFLNQ